MSRTAVTRPLPSDERLLRGLQSALAEMDVAGRPDLQHQVGMIRMVVAHLIRRRDLSGLPELYADMIRLSRETDSRFGSRAAPLPDTLAAGNYDAAQAQIGAALAALTDATSTAAKASLSAADGFWRAAQEVENRFYSATLPPPTDPPAVLPPLTRERFDAYLLAKFPGQFRRVTHFQRLVGGFQKETILIDAELAAGGIQAMVIRAEKQDRFVRMTASEIVDEYPIVELMWGNKVPVAEPLWLERDPILLGRRFMVSRRSPGVNTGSAYGNSQRFPPALLHSFLTTLAQIHRVPTDEAAAATALGKWLGHNTLADNTRAEIATWRHQIWLDRAPASPGFTRLFDWLEANVPHEDEAPCVLHNDYGPHNILVDRNAVSAVLDWEVPRIGDRAEDLSFFIQCAGGAIDAAEAVKLYVEISGHPIGRFRIAYFNVLSCAKVLVSTLSATTMYQATDPALIDWTQMPILAHGAYQRQVEDKIAAAEGCRGR
jgi:aminoglycoside phosphotransferase (APT) family kinase protein